MKLGDGVEQAIHCVAVLAALPDHGVLPAAALAEFHGVSPSYLVKHLQALAGAGLLVSVPGPAGGYRLARPPAKITLLDIVTAIEGPEPAFRCAEIRQRGPHPLPGKPTRPCEINAAMQRAEQAYRRELAKVTIAQLGDDVAANDPKGRVAARCAAFLDARMR
ncbi:MAG TPA: Rrf2 family transcriptional regulator [Kofleriaceae bacterium]|nr:Rrf2 family transcriptional regulator [Kofleriaceae bacterium]